MRVNLICLTIIFRMNKFTLCRRCLCTIVGYDPVLILENTPDALSVAKKVNMTEYPSILSMKTFSANCLEVSNVEFAFYVTDIHLCVEAISFGPLLRC